MELANNLNLIVHETVQSGVFVHIFHVDKECYVYDVVSSDIVKVTPFMGKILKILSKESNTSRKKGITALTNIYPGEKNFEGLKRIKIYQKKNIFCPIPGNLDIRIDNKREKKKSLTPTCKRLTNRPQRLWPWRIIFFGLGA